MQKGTINWAQKSLHTREHYCHRHYYSRISFYVIFFFWVFYVNLCVCDVFSEIFFSHLHNFSSWINLIGNYLHILCFHWYLWIHTRISPLFKALTLFQNNLTLLIWLYQERTSLRLQPLPPPLQKKMGKLSKHPSLRIVRPTYLMSISMMMKTPAYPLPHCGGCWLLNPSPSTLASKSCNTRFI